MPRLRVMTLLAGAVLGAAWCPGPAPAAASSRCSADRLIAASDAVVVTRQASRVVACRIRDGRTWRLGRAGRLTDRGYRVTDVRVAGRHVAVLAKRRADSTQAPGWVDHLTLLDTAAGPRRVPLGCGSPLTGTTNEGGAVLSLDLDRRGDLAWICFSPPLTQAEHAEVWALHDGRRTLLDADRDEPQDGINWYSVALSRPPGRLTAVVYWQRAASGAHAAALL